MMKCRKACFVLFFVKVQTVNWIRHNHFEPATGVHIDMLTIDKLLIWFSLTIFYRLLSIAILLRPSLHDTNLPPHSHIQ
jgi:hypothetical protein